MKKAGVRRNLLTLGGNTRPQKLKCKPDYDCFPPIYQRIVNLGVVNAKGKRATRGNIITCNPGGPGRVEL